MARPRSEGKRSAILGAAARVFAERGLGAPTSAISQAAKVAEGTVFTYFATKDELINELYREIKRELAEALMTGYPRDRGVQERLQYVWDRYLEWGVGNPVQHAALKQMAVWAGLTEESKAAGAAPFVEIQLVAGDAVQEGICDKVPEQYVAAAMEALAETTMEFMRRDPPNAENYRRRGFGMLWAGIAE